MNQSTDRLPLSTPDLSAQNMEQFTNMVQQLLPNCITEGKIDFDLLRQELSSEIVDGPKERYRLEWAGKREAIVTANMPIDKTLRPVREDSADFDTTQNLYIEGDNLEVLKLLQESYLGKVKMIYIDPPYNTGNEFVYDDDFSKEERDSLIEQGIIDEEGNILASDKNSKEKARYHSDWLTFMYPRLKLARNLLSEDGVIFISIDDNEVHNLRKMCDEVFGEGNFVANVIWQKKYAASNDSKGLSNMHDHILLYQKSALFNRLLLPRTDKQNSLYKYDSNDGKGIWRPDNLTVKTFSESYYYPIQNPNTGKEYLPSEGRCWLTNSITINKWIQEGRVFFGQDGNGAPQLKRYLSEVQQGIVPQSIWFYDECGHTDEARKEIKELFEKPPFDTPKPTRLLKRALQISTDKDSLILDFFAGSSTTAHAVMQLNAEDGGNRKYIMVQWPEATDEKSEAYKAGYKNICEIGKERIRRAAAKIKLEKQEKRKKEGMFSTDEDTQDYGFRVFRVDDSNMQEVEFTPQETQQHQLDLYKDNVKPGRTSHDLLFQVMLAWGLKLSLPISEQTIAGRQVYLVDDDALACCFEEGIDETFAEEIARLKPLRVVFKDASFADDTAKENVKQLLHQLSPDTEMKVI